MRVPQLAAASLALLLAHHRLLADLARHVDKLPAAAGAASFAAVEQCVRVLRRQCRELFLAPHLQ